MTQPLPNARRRWGIIALSLAIAGAVVAVAVWPGSAPPAAPLAPEPALHPEEAGPPAVDPRVAFATNFRNVRPGVKYVGDDACAGCHKQITQTYHAHPMGRSAEWIGRGPTAVDHTTGANNPFSASGFSLRVERNGNGVRHVVGPADGGDDAPRYAVAADLAIGSGTHGRSYLTFDRGAAWQSPVSWFGQAARWDVSPGFDLEKELRRPIIPQCLYCHTHLPESVPDSLNRYHEAPRVQASIGCERCHGPGELHVAERGAGADPRVPDDSIVNPARLPAELKADVCRQCHLQGAVRIARRGRELAEYRPGLPWEQFASTFLLHPDVTDYRKSVSQFEQMEVSRCFTGSAGKLGCVSCHNPHAKPAATETAAYFRSRCLSCHETRGCSAPAAERQGKGDSCIACHVPAREGSNVAHVAVTDHRIMRRPDAGGARAKLLVAGQMPLVAYRAGPHAPPTAERDRDLAIALTDAFARTGTSPDRWLAADNLLDRSLKRWPDDAPAWLSRSRGLGARGDGSRAVEAARAAAALNPQSELALVQVAAAATAAEDYELVISTADKLIALNPSSFDHRSTRASAHFFRNDWAKAEADCRAALGIQPLRPNMRFMLAVCLHKRGDPAAGRRELDLALKLTPSAKMRSTLTGWYTQMTR
jgi:hypothetical protein